MTPEIDEEQIQSWKHSLCPLLHIHEEDTKVQRGQQKVTRKYQIM